MDFIYVNILNEGALPYLREKGPLFGHRMATGVYSILSRDPRLKIELTTPAKAEQRRQEYLAKKIASNIKEEVKTAEVITAEVIETKVVEDVKTIEDQIDEIILNATTNVEEISEEKSVDADNEIDKILDETGEIPTAFNVKLESSETNPQNKVYSDTDIEGMTKAQLRDILKNRGYVRGPYAPKYQDNLTQLRAKVKKTQ